MRVPFAHAALALLTAGSLAAAWRSYDEYRAKKSLDRYRKASEIDYRAAGGDPRAVVEERIAMLRGSGIAAPGGVLGGSSAEPEIRTALALELVNAANAAILAAGGAAAADTVVGERLVEAEGEIRAALHADPTDTRAWIGGYRVCESARLLGRTALPGVGEARATAYLNGASRTNPHGGDLRRALATIMLAAGRRDEALAQFRLALRDPTIDAVGAAAEMLDAGYPPADVLETLPDRFQTRYGAGDLLLRLGDHDLAEKAFLDAARLEPSAHEPWIALADLAEDRGRHAEALAYARRGIARLARIPPEGRSAILLSAARASRSLGDAQGSIAYASRALAENPRNLFLYNFLGSALFERREFAGAITYWRSLIDDHASDPYVLQHAGLFHRSLGKSYLEIGDRERAVTSFLDALELDPSDQEARSAFERLASGR